MYTDYPTFAHIAVLVNGVYNQTISATANATTQTKTVILPAGYKTVEFITGATSKPFSNILGTYITAISASQFDTIVTPSYNARKVHFLSDSIGVGANATIPSVTGFVGLLKSAHSTVSFINEGYGYNTLFDYKDIIDDYVARIAVIGCTDFWCEVGTNDYALNKWADINNFKVAYAELLDKIHAQFPTAKLYAQGMIKRTIETANASGYTCGNFRTAISQVVSDGRTSYATYVDCSDLLPGIDGVHPTNHVPLKERIETTIII